LPRSADTTEGFFSRWVVVPFTAFFPAGVADPTLVDRLTRQESLQGLLRMAVGGLQQVMQRGAFRLPPSVISATARFKTEADPLRAFIDERVKATHANNPAFLARTDLYVAYTAWAAVNGFHSMSAQRFYESFGAASTDEIGGSVRAVTMHGTRGYKGIELVN
jgi:putative DNA primase/helicase